MDYKKQVLDIIKNHKYNITQKVKQNQELSNYILNTFPSRSLGESIFIFIKGDSDRYAQCGKEMKFNGFASGYSQTCSKSTETCQCLKSIKQKSMKKAFDTFYESTGFTHPSKNKKTIDNKKLNNQKKYGIENISQLEDVKNKKKETCFKRYGVETYLVTAESKNALIARNQELYGTDYRWQSVKGKEEIRNILIKQRKDNSGEFRNKSIYDILRSEELLSSLYTEFGNSIMLANTLNISVSYMNFWLREHNISVGNGSAPEKQLVEYIKSIYNHEIILNSRNVLSNGQEIDIYLPDIKLGIEYNGSYWHSTKHKDRLYHKNKSNQAKIQDIELIHVHESDWETKNEIVKNRIEHKLKVNSNKIYARECKVKYINSSDARIFAEENHLFGFIGAKHHLGLIHNGELVGYMSFGESRKGNNWDYELLRFVTSTAIIGGASKLFSFFIKKENPKSIYSYSDNDWGVGGVYHHLGFNECSQTDVGYWYINAEGRHNRIKFQKHKLIQEGFDVNKTESEIMDERGYLKYYDSGNTIWEWYSK